MNQNNINRRKYILWTFLPMVIAIGIQLAVTMFAIQAFTVYSIYNFKGESLADFYILVNKMAMAPWFEGLILGGYAVVGVITFGLIYSKFFADKSHGSFIKESLNLPATLGGFVLFVIGMQYVCNYLIASIAAAFPEIMETYVQLIESAGLGSRMAVITALYALILGPVCEELIFRGITYKAAEKYLPIPAAIFIQAFLFGSYHMNLMQGIYAFVLGLGLGYVMYLYDDLKLTILIHIAYNTLGTIGAGLLPMGASTIATFFICLLSALIAVYGSLLLFRKGSKRVNKVDTSADI